MSATNTSDTPFWFTRRRLILGGAAATATSLTKNKSARASAQDFPCFQSRWITAAAQLHHGHPKRWMWGEAYWKKTSFVWVSIDLETEDIEVLEPDHPLYEWPLARWYLTGDKCIPYEWGCLSKTDSLSKLVPPKSAVVWNQFGVIGINQKGSDLQLPRFVRGVQPIDIVKGINEELFKPLGASSLPYDSRDDMAHCWMNFDLLTGEIRRCTISDPIFSVHSSIFAHCVSV